LPSTEKYDLIVIGAGAAGSTAAETALSMGAKVALIERDKLGGTCLNYGCDPTKTLLYAARRLHEARHAEPYGLRIPKAEADWGAVQAHVRDVIREIRGGSHTSALASLRSKGLHVRIGVARFVSPHEITVAGETLRADAFVIATGTEAAVPEIEGLTEAGFITNREAVSLPELPRSMAVVGAGPIGLEFAQMFSRFGVDVTVLDRNEVPLPTEDRELAEALCGLLGKEGIKIVTNVEPHCSPPEAGGKKIKWKQEGGRSQSLVVDEILVATGRKPSLGPLHLEAAGVEAGEEGIKADDHLRTGVAHIWAAGDITGGPQFTHVASLQGKIAARNALGSGGKPEGYDGSLVPWVTYTDPELAHVGQTEEELEEAGMEYQALRLSMSDLDRARTMGRTEGMVKLLVGRDGKILGGHILAPGAGELIAPVVLAMKVGLKVEVLAETVLPYPTLAESVRWAADRRKRE
jgi:pyruvate/2-oxoglutarate dehydrogenase complex dihydrolipoamide dehydrogenase (E3) component